MAVLPEYLYSCGTSRPELKYPVGMSSSCFGFIVSCCGFAASVTDILCQHTSMLFGSHSEAVKVCTFHKLLVDFWKMNTLNFN